MKKSINKSFLLILMFILAVSGCSNNSSTLSGSEISTGSDKSVSVPEINVTFDVDASVFDNMVYSKGYSLLSDGVTYHKSFLQYDDYFISDNILYQFCQNGAKKIYEFSLISDETIDEIVVRNNYLYYAVNRYNDDGSEIRKINLENNEISTVHHGKTFAMENYNDNIYISSYNNEAKHFCIGIIDTNDRISFIESAEADYDVIDGIVFAGGKRYMKLGGNIIGTNITMMDEGIKICSDDKNLYAYSFNKTIDVYWCNVEDNTYQKIASLPQGTIGFAIKDKKIVYLNKGSLFFFDGNTTTTVISGLSENIKDWRIENSIFYYYVSPKESGSVSIKR